MKAMGNISVGKIPRAAIKTPLSEEILKNYNLNTERIQIANYQLDLTMRKLKGCL